MDDSTSQSDDLTAEDPASSDPGPALPGMEDGDAQSRKSYQVLARKYRPQRFEDLIGQDAMVRTLTNAFAADRIAHAYMLTGVRGVGKTTTARLIARALNYATDNVDQPSITLDPPGFHCDAIARSAHVDVMEMDAASRTGVGDIREILEGVRYSPVSARYKVYIIDEVHMLSTQAFNALLKTLEEPPPHVKFIFATTEIRKVPVTILSRCQRFDLKRIDRDVLTAHLAGICEQENAKVEDDGLKAIARAAEGSVRDALSLLDQAIVQADDDTPVSAEEIRDMLGLADRSRILDLLEATLKSDGPKALGELRDQYDRGADPQVLMRDLLDYLHAMSRIKAAGPEVDLGEAKETQDRLIALAETQSLAGLTRLWKTALTGYDDVRNAPDPVSAAEMAVIRLMAAASLPPPEDAARLLAGQSSSATSAPAPAAETKSQEPVAEMSEEPVLDADTPVQTDVLPSGPQSLEELVQLIDNSRDLKLKLDVERYVRPVTVDAPKLIFEATDNAPSNLARRLAAFLKDTTGTMWLVDGTGDAKGAETWTERRRREKQERLDNTARDPNVMKIMTAFPGAELVRIEEPNSDANADKDTPDEADTERMEQTR